MVFNPITLSIGAPAIKRKGRPSSVNAVNLLRKGTQLLMDQIGSKKSTNQ